MTYKTILVHCTDHPTGSARIKLAIDLAKRSDAHLIGMAVLSAPQLPVDMMAPPSAQLFGMIEEGNRTRLASAKALFQRETAAAGIAAEYIERVDEPIEAFATAMRYADVAVVGQKTDDGGDATLPDRRRRLSHTQICQSRHLPSLVASSAPNVTCRGSQAATVQCLGRCRPGTSSGTPCRRTAGRHGRCA